ncbi:MAG TPA: hypothetical protein VIS72_05010 [Anaerolineales bacterium]
MTVNDISVCVLIDQGYDEFDPSGYLNDYAWEKVEIESPLYETLLSVHERGRFDVYLNLCEGYEEPYYSGLDVVHALEKLRVPFTGADSRFYRITRETMGAVAENVNVKFVRGANVTDVGEVEALASELGFPLMVKHPNSYGSTGMTRNSQVDDMGKLKQQVRRICKNFGSARVEEFVDGREFTVFVVDNPDDLNDPFVYPPAELSFPAGESFLHSNVKWKEWVYLKRVTDNELALRLKEMSVKLFKALNGTGYARSDIRMNGQDELVMIEINPNNGILYKPEDLGPADVMMEYDSGGHAGFLDRIIRSALIRHRERHS